MEIVGPSSEDEAAATFERAELAGRFRGEILAGTRGWRIGGLFDGLPDDLEWYRVALEPAEVLAIRYINWDWWLEITDGTRLPTDARVADPESHRAIAERQEHELIAVATALDAPPVLVEGHVRLTAYALFPELLPARLEILLGVSERAAEWSNF